MFGVDEGTDVLTKGWLVIGDEVMYCYQGGVVRGMGSLCLFFVFALSVLRLLLHSGTRFFLCSGVREILNKRIFFG